MKFDLCDIFERCLHAKYIDVENKGSYASYKIDNKRYIFFEHSNGLEDWKNNFDFPSTPYKDMDVIWKCHRGFLKVWKSISPYIEKIIKPKEEEYIVVAGYSHGAALSSLCYEYIWYNYSEIRSKLYGFSFGSPKIFYGSRNYDFLNFRFDKFLNIINSNDIVTKVPPWFLGYRHLGKILHIGNEKSFFSINAHRPENYLSSLKSIKCIVEF